MIYWIWLTELGDIGPVTQRRLLEVFKDPEVIYNCSLCELLECKGIGEIKASKIVDHKDLTSASQVLIKCEEIGTNIVTINSVEYPKKWKLNNKIPVLFYYMGQIKDITNADFICYNTKELYEEVERDEYIEIAESIIKNNEVYIGTLNEGVDHLIHSYLVDHNRFTLLLMANGAERCFPNRHKNLYDAVLQNGAALSIYPPMTKLNRFRLPKRNRDVGIMSGQGIERPV